MSANKKPAKNANMDELQKQLQDLLAQGKKEGMLRATDLNALLEKMTLSTEKIEEVYDKIEAMNIQIISPELELDLGDDPLLDAGLEGDIDLTGMEDEDLVDPVDLAAEYNLDDPVRMYLKEIGKVPLLTAEEEIEIAKRMEEGDEDAKQKLTEANLRLVVSIAREYAGRGVPLLDLVQEGSIGLLTAARKFDYTLNNRFSTYATKWIYRGIIRCLLEHGKLIRIPANTAEQMWKLDQARNALIQETGRDPELPVLARRCGMTEAKVEQLLQLQPELCSLDAPAGETEESSIGDLLEDLQASHPQEELVRQELEQIMEGLLGRLYERQRRILRLHFGMEDGTCYSLEQISKVLNISKERVRQVEKQAMEKLQKLGADLGLEDFLSE